MINLGIDVIDKGWQIILWKMEGGGEMYVSSRCCVQSMSNIQLPLSKVSFSFIGRAEAHVLLEMKDLNPIPEVGTLYAGSNNIRP